MSTEQPPHPVEPGHRVAEQLPQRHDEHVADCVAGQLARAGEPVLDHLTPRPAPLVVAAQRGERHTQITRREYTELLA